MTYSVIVIRDEDQLIPAKYINRFFKLCGIYTYDYAMPQHAGNSGFPDCFGFDCIILMTHQSNAKAALKTYSNQSIVEFPVPADANLSDREKRKEFGKEAKTKVLETVGDDLTDAYDIFVDEDVAYLDFMLRWRVAPDRLDNWLSVCNKLPFDGCVQQKYAYLNCCRQVNKICAECRQIAVFDDSKLMAAAVKLCEEDKRFTIAYVLAGLIGLRNPDTESQAEQYLQQVTEREKGVVYADFVYYVLGEYYEVDRHDWMFGWMWYQRMVGCPLQERRKRPVTENDGTVLLNTFCKKAGEVINLDGIDMIAANAFNGCESINIINTEYVSICSEGAFKNSAVERLPFVNGVRMVGCMLVGIDNTCDNIVIPDDEVNISTIISGLDWSHVKNVTVSHASTVYDMSMTAKAMPKKVTVMSVEGYELKTLKLANISYVNIVNSSHYRTIDGIVYSLDGKCLIACPTGRTGRVDIPEGVEEIARNAFKLGNLEEVYFPSTLKKVGDMAFFYCKNLKKVDFGTGLEMIGSNAEKQCFASCDNLKSIIIPPQVKSIGSRAFENSAVNELCISEGLVSVSNNAFNGCPIKTVKLPESLKSISEDAFFGTDTVIARRYDTDLLSSVMKSLDRKIPFSYIKKEMDKSTGCSICLTDIIINERSALIPKYADNSITFSNIDAVLHMYFSSKTVPEKVMHEVRSMFMYFGKKDDREFMAIEMYLRDKSNDVAKEYIYSHSRHIIQNFVTNNRTEEEIMNFIKLGLMTAEACEYILDVAIKKEYTEISAYALNMLGKYPAEKQKFAL